MQPPGGADLVGRADAVSAERAENMPALHSCAVYLSSGLSSVASRVATAAAQVPRVAVVDTFTDVAYARSSVKLVAEPEPLLKAAKAAVAEGLALIDLTQEPHPAPVRAAKNSFFE